MRHILILLSVVSSLSVNAATVSVAGATFKVRRSQPPLPSRSVVISAARNEFEPFQLLVTGPATGVTAIATALSNGKVSIGPVRLFREELITISNLSAPDAIVVAGEALPDALIPARDELDNEERNAFVGFNVTSGETRAIWGEVRVPESAPAGTYTGSVTVRFKEGSSVVPVTLTVYDFTLPAKASLKSAFGLAYNSLLAGHGISRSALPALRVKYDTLALDHRVSLSKHDDGDRSLSHFIATYGPFVAGTGPTQTPGAALSSVEFLGDVSHTAEMSSWYDSFAANTWDGRLFHHTCDEPPRTCGWRDIPPRLQAAKAASPAFRTLLTTNLPEIRDAEARYGISIAANLDLIVPVINHLYDRPGHRFAGPQWQTYSAFVESGPRKELWSYQSCMSHGCNGMNSYYTGWPSYMIDASAVRNRAMQWLEFLYRATGELYYETTMAYLHDAWSNQWDFSGNGDGTLFYPGTPARVGGETHIPIASLRLKMIREGMEDFEYLTLVSNLGDRAMAEREAQALFPTAYQTEANPDALMAARARIAQRIMELQRGGGGGLGYGAPFSPDIVVNGDPAEFQAKAVTLSGAAAGSDNTAEVRISYDDEALYASWVVRDGTIVVNQGGRDGELWNGDSVELFLAVGNDKSMKLNPNHYHLLVNTNGDLTDERGREGGWDRSWRSGAGLAVTRSSTGYNVELKVPWSSLGVSPCARSMLGLDIAVNDVDSAGASPRPFDWAGLARFAQPNLWGRLFLTATLAGDVYLVQRASRAVTIDGDLSEFARAPSLSLTEAARGKGSDNQPSVRILYDATNLYAAFTVRDASLGIVQGGRDGEVWNGDGVELMLDPLSTRTAAPDADDRHVLVNANGDLTDERGNAGAWDRSWTAGAAVRIAGIPGSYSVELSIPWSALGLSAPPAGTELGMDVANNDLDARSSLIQLDWAGLTRFAQPALWKRARLDSRVPACTDSNTPPPSW